MTKKLLLLATLLLSGIAGAYADDGMLVYTASSEEPARFDIDNVKEIQFTETGFTVVSLSDETTDFSYAELAQIKFDYTAPVADAISTVSSDDLSQPGVEVYDLQGRRQSVSELSPAGIYVVRMNGQTFKMLKK